MGGKEICDGWSELTDPQEQRKRFMSDVKAARKDKEEAQQVDENFLEAMEYGMPPIGGIGIGIDRLTMFFTNTWSIMKVLRFSIGFGKPLWTRRIGPDQMEFVVAALPLGGYVKMLDETEGEVRTEELSRAFNRQPVWKRMVDCARRAVGEFLFAILAYWVVNMAGIEGIEPVVGRVLEVARLPNVPVFAPAISCFASMVATSRLGTSVVCTCSSAHWTARR